MKFANRNSLNIRLGAMAKNVRPTVLRSLRRGALQIENTAVEGIIDPPKTGKIYRRNANAGKLTKTGRKRKAQYIDHQASAPGEFPAADTGRLHQSITTAVVQNDDRAVIVETGANTPYAEALEYGTAKMEPRPYMTPAFRAHAERIKDEVTLAIAQAIRQSGRSK